MEVIELKHPLVEHKLAILRDKKTGTKEFREIVSELATILCYEAMKDSKLEEVEIETPIQKMKTRKINEDNYAFVPILRAGTGMLDGIIQVVPNAKIGHVGMYRDEETFKPNVYFLEGHNTYSSEYFQGIKEDISAESNEVNTLNILTTGSIPENCDCLVITTLQDDLSEMEKDKIVEYINNGGKILLLADANVAGTQMPNFNEILKLYGFNISNGILLEQDENQMIYNSPEFIIAKINSDSVISKNINMNMNICVIDSGRIEFEDEEKLESLGVTYETIATTSDTAFIRNNYNISTYKKTNQDEDAANSIIGAVVTKTLDGDKKSELIVYSNAVFATNQQINVNNTYAMTANKICNNDDVVINSVAYLTKRTDTITIRKDYDSVSYTVTQKQHNIIMAVIFIIPILIIIAGIIVWQIRRRKK